MKISDISKQLEAIGNKNLGILLESCEGEHAVAMYVLEFMAHSLKLELDIVAVKNSMKTKVGS